MKKILILGAGGQIAHWVVQMLAGRDDVRLTLFVRRATSFKGDIPPNATVVEGDVLDLPALAAAVSGQDIVYANLARDVDQYAANILTTMTTAGVNRLIFVTSLGIYDEIPGKFGVWNHKEIGAFLPSYRKAADLIEASSLNYAIIRPAWLTDEDEVEYETTGKDESFKGTEVSRKSVAALITKVIDTSKYWTTLNLGVNKPNTDGDRPAFV